MKTTFFLTLIFLIFGINACNKEDNTVDYQAVVASNIGTTVYLSVEDDKGNNLLSDKSFVEKMNLYGELSKRNISFSLSELNNNAVIDFGAELPDWRNMLPPISDNTALSYGNSTMTLRLGKQSLKLNATFKYQNSSPETKNMIGGTGIHIETIEINSKTFTKQSGELIIPLVYANNQLSLKE